jgi:hypothetical protein
MVFPGQITKPLGIGFQLWKKGAEPGIQFMTRLGDKSQLQQIFGDNLDRIMAALALTSQQPDVGPTGSSAGSSITPSPAASQNKRPLPATDGKSDESNPSKRLKQIETIDLTSAQD